MKIIVDAMGGDHAPEEIVKGCLDALKKAKGFELELVGDKDRIESLIHPTDERRQRITITHAPDVITNHDKPTEAIRTKNQSSLVVGLKQLRDKCGQVFISAGSTGALLTGSLLIPGRIKGINRPALAPILPSASGGTMLIDAGMNTTMKPVNYLQFGVMGSTYMKEVNHIASPRVGLVNVGTETGKGNPIVQEAYALLAASGLNFIGNIEGSDITSGAVDVAVCDGFTGNAMLKMMEGTGKYFFNHLKKMYTRNFMANLAAAIVKRDLSILKKTVDPEEVGGTPLLGIDGVVYKCHGNSKARGISNTILKICNGACLNVTEQIRTAFLNVDTVENGGL